MKTITFAITLLLSSVSFALHAFPKLDIQGRVDVGPAYIHLDVLESNKTIKKLDMPGLRADATVAFYKGFCIKPFITYGNLKGEIVTAGIGIGHFIPFNDNFCVTPVVGYGYTYLNTHIDVPYPDRSMPITILSVKEKFYSKSPYIGLDAHYKFAKKWRVGGFIQYSWSRTDTKISGLGLFKSKSRGPSFGGFIERDLGDKWSLNLGFAYNLSLTKEKHGLRAAGVRLGIARWF